MTDISCRSKVEGLQPTWYMIQPTRHIAEAGLSSQGKPYGWIDTSTSVFHRQVVKKPDGQCNSILRFSNLCQSTTTIKFTIMWTSGPGDTSRPVTPDRRGSAAKGAVLPTCLLLSLAPWYLYLLLTYARRRRSRTRIVPLLPPYLL